MLSGEGAAAAAAFPLAGPAGLATGLAGAATADGDGGIGLGGAASPAFAIAANLVGWLS